MKTGDRRLDQIKTVKKFVTKLLKIRCQHGRGLGSGWLFSDDEDVFYGGRQASRPLRPGSIQGARLNSKFTSSLWLHAINCAL
jgi:hypothetical protein